MNTTSNEYDITLPSPNFIPLKPAERSDDTKEQVASRLLMCIHDGEIREAITLRIYMGRSRSATKVYASIWIRGLRGLDNGRGFLTSGRGSAGGGGYCKFSAAADEALRAAGVDVKMADSGEPASLHGAGMPAIERVMVELAAAMGWDTTGCKVVS